MPAGASRGEESNALAHALYEGQVPVVWNDLISEVERIHRRKNQSPLSASWHRNVSIALKQFPFELTEATPEAIRDLIDQMQELGSVVGPSTASAHCCWGWFPSAWSLVCFEG